MAEEFFPTQHIHSVSGLTALIRQNLADSFPFLWVRGEVTDCSISPSDHLYFSLRDKDALLQCVWFSGKRKKGAAGRKFDPLTGEVYESPPPVPEEFLRNGVEIVCAGSINVYPRGGRYQLVVEHAEAAGLGTAALLLEQRRAKYAAAGYFAMERKRKLPANPVRIALVTSLHGAAIHDFLKLACARGLSARIRIFPVPVQGQGAAVAMAQAIEEVNRQNEAQAIVLVRGGGSREDLAEFNEEILVEAIYHSKIPVLAGIGHEVDTSLADMTADVRAATPSHAAQLLWPLRSDLWQELDDLSFTLARRMNGLMEKLATRWEHLNKTLSLLSPWQKLESLNGKLSIVKEQFDRAISMLLSSKKGQLLKLEERRSIANRLRGKLINDAHCLNHLAKRVDEGLKNYMQMAEKRLTSNEERLSRIYPWCLQNLTLRLDSLEHKLAAANPFAPLGRGYVFCTINGHILRTVKDCEPGAVVMARLCDGEIEMVVRKVRKLPTVCPEINKE